MTVRAANDQAQSAKKRQRRPGDRHPPPLRMFKSASGRSERKDAPVARERNAGAARLASARLCVFVFFILVERWS